jgi:acyl-coenzyme A thioesterase PaaI-like protein
VRTGPDTPLPTLRTWHCFGCDPAHPKGLRLPFTVPGSDRLRSDFSLDRDYTGVGSIVHGGIIATVFDDVMMWCLLRHRRRFYVTTQMEQRLLRPALADVALRAEATIGEETAERVTLHAVLSTVDDPATPLARGSGTFVPMPERLAALLPAEQRAEMEQLFVGFEQAEH